MHSIDYKYACITRRGFSRIVAKTSAWSRPSRHIRHIAGMLFMLVGCIFGTVAIAEQASAASPNAVPRAEALTTSLLGLYKAYQYASPAAKAAALETLISTATERQAQLAELMEKNPGVVLRVALPDQVRAGMPAEVREHLEKRIALSGELDALYEDYDNGTHRLRHFLRVDNELITLHFAGDPPALLSGTFVRASGVLLGDAMALESGDSALTLATGGGENGGSNGGIPAPIANSMGEQRTLVILVNFQDNPDAQPWPVADVEDAVFGTVSDFFRENSYGRTWLSGDVYGWFTIPLESTVCDLMQIESGAINAASAAGAVLSNYTRYVYVYPQTSSCSWSGASMVGGNPSRAWINGDLRLEIIGHEMGHSFGLYHGHSLVCEGITLGNDCKKLEYGDGVDIMGWSDSAHFSSFNKERLGWLNDGESPPITTATDGGTFVLDPYAPSGTNPKALKLYKGIDPITGRGIWYYLEYRQATGFDSVLASSLGLMDSSNVLNGLVIRTAIPEQSGNTGYLLDMTPETYQLYTRDPALTVGQSYADPDAGLTITTLWADGNSAGVDVNFGTQTCVHADPILQVTPSESPWAAPGTPLAYTVTVSNNDSNACGTTTFNLLATAPAGWDIELSSSTVQIAAGTSDSVIMTITSPKTGNNGFYDITITASESNDSAFTGSTTATYVIDTTDSTPTCTPQKPEVILSPSSQSAIAGTVLDYTVSVTNQDTLSCTQSTFTLNHDAPLDWSGSFSNSTLTLTPGETGSVSFSVTSYPSAAGGTYDISVDVTDSAEAIHTAAGNASYTVVEACAPATPALSLSPGSQNANPGSVLVYTISLANKDSTACNTSNFDLTIYSLPSGWDGTLSPTSISLSPGSSGTANLSVVSAGNALPGSYNLQVATSDAIETAHAKAATATYVVNDTTPAEDTQPPSVPTGLGANLKGNQVGLFWNTSSDNVGIAGYRVWRDGEVIANITDAGYIDRDLADNTLHEYRVDAYDAANNISGKSDSVTAGKTKGGGNKGQGNNK